jgi:hypothetical protein
MRGLGVCVTAVMTVIAGSARARADEAPRLPWEHLSSATVLASALFGDGLRFDNPYRLATPLGSTAESVSRTSSYVDLGVAIVLGDARGLQHGAALRTSVAVEGVQQGVFTPSYLLWRRFKYWALFGRVGPSIVLAPDLTWGFEASAGGAWFARAGVGVAAELVGDVFYGAGTRDVATPAYPVLSGQLGVIVSYEVFP